MPGWPAWGEPGSGSTRLAFRPVRRLGTALVIVLVLNALSLLLWTAGFMLLFPAAVLILIWFFSVRANVEGRGVQRRGLGWAVGSWFCPVVNLWFPLQITGDVARVDLPPERQRFATVVRYAWWACWLLSWLTAVQITRNAVSSDGSYRLVAMNVSYGQTTASRLCAAVAALLLAIVVRDISTRQQRRHRRQATAGAAGTIG